MGPFPFDEGEAGQPSPAQVAAEAEAAGVAGGRPRLRLPQRDQLEIRWASLDELLEPDHQARVVWAAVCRLDLSDWLGEIKAVEGHVGRDATDPRVLVALWVYATLDGVASARAVARLCREHLAYQWLCGGVSVNHHMLSDFRSQGEDHWDALLTQIVGSLLAEDLVTMERVAQDGMRVRANAGKSSFRRRGRLEECLEDARQQVEALKQLAANARHVSGRPGNVSNVSRRRFATATSCKSSVKPPPKRAAGRSKRRGLRPPTPRRG